VGKKEKKEKLRLISVKNDLEETAIRKKLDSLES